MPYRLPAHAGPGPLPALCAAASLLLLAGCAATRPDPQAEAAAAAATGIQGAIAFRTEGGPLDEPAAAESLTLADAAQRAVTTSPELQAALARVRVAMADADQARLLPNPVLDIVLRWGPGKPQIEAALAADLVQVLQVRRRASAADNRLRAAAADAATVALDVVAEVQERYANVQAFDATLPLLRERLELLRRLAETARARREAGEGTAIEVTALEAQRVELEVEMAAAELQAREERLRLARLLGEPSSAATWTIEAWTRPELVQQPESAWIQTALAQRPEVQSAAWKLAALGDDEALAKLLPWEGGGVGVDAQRDGDWSAGPSVSTPVPIFDSGQARRARITAEQAEARHELTLARRKVVEEVRVAYETLAAGRANLDRIRNQLLPIQQRRRQVTGDLYEMEREVTPMLLAEQDLRAAEARAIDAQRQASIALIRLRRAAGGAGAAAAVGQSRPASPEPDAPTPVSWSTR